MLDIFRITDKDVAIRNFHVPTGGENMHPTVSENDVVLNVNGVERRAGADGDIPLLYVLREVLGLKGARFGCGSGECGACIVIVEGEAVTSCNLPLSAVAGKRVETVESLTRGPHPLVAAATELQVAQCGYCLPGILMSAKALLDSTPRPSREKVAEALDGNLCRCGAHPRIMRAVVRAAEIMDAHR